jgi:hypothetical protein
MRNTVDDLLDIGASFDIITVGFAFLRDILNGPPADFGIPSFYHKGDIKGTLERSGVKVWGMMLSPNADMLMFSVKKSQAQWAYTVLKRARVQMMYTPWCVKVE